MSRLQRKWGVRSIIALSLLLPAIPLLFAAVVEAPAGFDDLTNGFVNQATFDADKEIFDSREEADEGLGPVYNAQACAECHQNPVSGATSQITELRVGRMNGSTFVDRPGGSLINDRAIHPNIQERVAGEDTVRTFRTSLNILGDGFVEAISNTTLQNIQAAQPSSIARHSSSTCRSSRPE